MSQSVRLKFGFLSGVIFEFEFSRVVGASAMVEDHLARRIWRCNVVR